MRGTKLGSRVVVAARRRVDIRAGMLAGIMCGCSVRGIRFGQAVGRLWSVWAAVHAMMVIKGARIDARGVRVQQRAADFVVVGALAMRGVGVVLSWWSVRHWL